MPLDMPPHANDAWPCGQCPACSLLDELVGVHGVHKVETAGDCYIVSAGVLATGPDGFMRVLDSHDAADSAARVLAFAKGL
jgi:hypothetical protein